MKDSAMESNQELMHSKTSLAIEKNTKCDDEEQKKMFELKNTTKFVSILKPKEQQEPNLENLEQQRKLKVKTCSACGKSFNKRATTKKLFAITKYGSKRTIRSWRTFTS